MATTAPKTPLDGLIRCGIQDSDELPRRDRGPRSAVRVLPEAPAQNQVRLDAHVTDRLVISGVLAAVLSDTVIAAMQSALMELEEQGGGADAFRAEDMGL